MNIRKKKQLVRLLKEYKTQLNEFLDSEGKILFRSVKERNETVRFDISKDHTYGKKGIIQIWLSGGLEYQWQKALQKYLADFLKRKRYKFKINENTWLFEVECDDEDEIKDVVDEFFKRTKRIDYDYSY